MWTEITEQEYVQLREYLKVNDISYEPSDCTLPGDDQRMIHLEFSDLTAIQIEKINAKLDDIALSQAFKEEEKQEEFHKDMDADGIEDRKEAAAVEQEEEQEYFREKYHPKKKDEGYTTPAQAAKEWFFGEDER